MLRVAKIRRFLLTWYDTNARSLPWRGKDAYGVWLSEIMLQQTTVAHAAPYFLKFMARWPSVAHLAEAADAEVMAAWAGLGYYARARTLLACARAVTADHDGAFPQTEERLRRLPGVGAYTAAAVAAIAFSQTANVVDGNVERVMSRLFAVEDALPAAKPELARLAATLVRDDRPGDWAQALMDLGATICRPKSPACAICPLASLCQARSGGAPETYPRRSAKRQSPHRYGVAYRLIQGDRVAMVRRPDKGLLGGMLALPTSEWRASPWSAAEAVAAAPAPGNWRPAGQVEHVFTHFSLTLTVYEAEPAGNLTEFLWIPPSEAAASSPTVFRKALLANP